MTEDTRTLAAKLLTPQVSDDLVEWYNTAPKLKDCGKIIYTRGGGLTYVTTETETVARPPVSWASAREQKE